MSEREKLAGRKRPCSCTKLNTTKYRTNAGRAMARQGPVWTACADKVAPNINWIMMWLAFLSPGAQSHTPKLAQLATKNRLAIDTKRVHLRVCDGVRAPWGKRARVMNCGASPTNIWQYQPTRRLRSTHWVNI